MTGSLDEKTAADDTGAAYVRRASSDGGEIAVFGVSFDRMVVRSALGWDHQGEDYRRDFVRRHTDAVSSLIDCRDERLTYDLRLIVEPGESGRGAARLGVLGALRGGARREADELAEELFRLVDATYPEVDARRIPRERLGRWLAPFPVAEAARIERRWRWQPLDSVVEHRGPRVLGFGDRQEAHDPEDDRVLYVFPFVPLYGALHPLLRLLLAQPHPMMVSVRLRPTSLTEDERGVLLDQVARCETYMQTALGPADRLERLRPTLQMQARLLQSEILRQLHALDDDAAEVTVEALSGGRLGRGVLEALGHVMSTPAGGGGDPEAAVRGGFEVVRDDAATRAAAAAELSSVVPAVEGLATTERRLPWLFDAWQAAGAFRIPHAEEEPLAGVAVRRHRLQPPPEGLPHDGTTLGRTVSADPAPVRARAEDRLRHLYVVGQTGTGKTTLIRRMIEDDLASGEGLCLIDPHGDLFEDVLGAVPPSRREDVVVLDPTDRERPVGINVLECQPGQRFFVTQQVLSVIERLMLDEYGESAHQMMGPVFMQHVRMNLLLLLSAEGDPPTLRDFYHLFTATDAWKEWAGRVCDPAGELSAWINRTLPETDYQRAGSEGVALGGYINSKLVEFVFDPLVADIFNQRHSTVDLRRVMDEGKILLVNLAQGRMTTATSRFLGMIVLVKLLQASLSRIDRPQTERPPFFVYVDEFQTMATRSFVNLLSEGRKFGLGLTLANQFVQQVEDPRIPRAIFGNVGGMVVFRVGREDAEFIEPYMAPAFTARDLTTLPNWQAAARLLIDGRSSAPFNLETVLPDTEPSPEVAEEVRTLSRERYGGKIQDEDENPDPADDPSDSGDEDE